ncbi:hypothetical protein KBD18_01610 [Patescibacteria group bacterium]|nr:hypothetical protein [Patescibacteria group bacterium]
MSISAIKRLVKRLAHTVLVPYVLLRSTEVVWMQVLNRKARMFFISHRPQLTREQQRLVDDLKRDGIAVTTLDALFPGEHALLRLRSFADAAREQGYKDEGKPFLQMYWDRHPLIDLQNPFTTLVLRPQILDIVNGYLALWTKFVFSALDRTTPVASGSMPLRSQNWHRDPEDKKMCKVFIYLNDVDEDAGPFVYVRGSHYGGSWRHLFPQKPPRGSYPPPGAVESSIPAKDVAVCTAPAGTVIFADTSGLHRGGFAFVKERLMYTADFITMASLRPSQHRLPDGGVAGKEHLSPAGQFAIDLPKRRGFFIGY